MPEIVHLCPTAGQYVTPCCRRTPFELFNHRLTTNPDLVTCPSFSRRAPERFKLQFAIPESLVMDAEAAQFFGEQMWREILANAGGTPAPEPRISISTRYDPIHDVMMMLVSGDAFQPAPPQQAPEPLMIPALTPLIEDDDYEDDDMPWSDAAFWTPEKELDDDA